MQLYRLFHTARCLWNPVQVEKAALSKLRKSTGYPFSKCKEALQKYENDFKQAEQWLKDQAQAHGWEKATKLQGRATVQGLVSLFSSPNSTVMIEMNCETDFVARNKKFQSLVQKITNGCQLFSNSSDQHSPSAILSKIPLSGEELANIPLAENRMVKDEIALSIGEVGENIKTRRAVCFKSSGPVLLVGYTHPAPEGISANAKEFYCSGKYGAIVAFRPTESKSKSEKRSRSQESLTLVGKQLCQHVVGMNPKEIGSMEQPVVAQQGEKPNVVVESSGVNQDSSVAVSIEEEGKPDAEIDETVLVNQEFLLDPDITVREFLIQNSIEVLDYIRFECGESVSDSICE